jgi:hypothetical protein
MIDADENIVVLVVYFAGTVHLPPYDVPLLDRFPADRGT